MSFDLTQQATLCEDLSLARAIPRSLREEARHQLYFHLKPAPELFASWDARRIPIIPPYGWRPMNPSVTRLGDEILVAVRCTNYIIDDRGPRHIVGTGNFSRTLLFRVGDQLDTYNEIGEVLLPEPLVEHQPGAQAGFEDMRIFASRGELWGIMVRCDQNPECWPEQWLARIPLPDTTMTELRRLPSPFARRPEKNWMPLPDDEAKLYFVYCCDPVTILRGNGRLGLENPSPIAADHFRGSSQLIAFDGGWLALVHSVTMHKLWPKNMHRCVWFSSGMCLVGLTDAFLFPPSLTEDYLNGYQYAMGLCMHPDGKKLILSYQVGECQPWLATIDANDVRNAMRSV